MKGVCIRVRRNSKELFDERMDLLQKPVSPESGVVGRRDLSYVSVEHPVSILFDPHGLPTFSALDDDLYLAVLLPLGLKDASERSDRVDLVGGRLVDSRI